METFELKVAWFGYDEYRTYKFEGVAELVAFVDMHCEHMENWKVIINGKEVISW